jgi:hypothetical protein
MFDGLKRRNEMPTAFFRTKLKQGVTREAYRQWVADFVYPHVEKIQSVISHRIYHLDETIPPSGKLPYDNIEVIKFTNWDDYVSDLQHNPAAAAIAEQMSKYVKVLDSVYGKSIPPGVTHSEVDTPEPGAKTLKCRTGQHVLKVDFYPIPSTPQGHLMGAGQSAGLAFFESGEVANLAMAFTVDFPDGRGGTHALYTEFSFEDGSSFVILELGTTTPGADGKTALFDSTSISFVEGSGRFAGIRGGGVMTGKRFAPLGVNADTYLDYTLTYKLPT